MHYKSIVWERVSEESSDDSERISGGNLYAYVTDSRRVNEGPPDNDGCSFMTAAIFAFHDRCIVQVERDRRGAARPRRGLT